MSNKKVNENYIHNCESEKVDISSHICSIIDMGFNSDKLLKILKFYLFNAPILSSKKESNVFGLKSLQSFGWYGNKELSKLEGRLLSSAGMSIFCFIKSDSINNTIENMNLNDKVCIEHNRAVLKLNFKSNVEEDGSFTISPQETRMQCLLRHIRNSFAHNHTYLFENNKILIEDCDEDKKISARILIDKNVLLKWIEIISSGP